jgi:hypothetical protein
MRWVGHAANMREIRNAYKFWSESLKGRVHLKDPGTDGMIILK